MSRAGIVIMTYEKLVLVIFFMIWTAIFNFEGSDKVTNYYGSKRKYAMSDIETFDEIDASDSIRTINLYKSSDSSTRAPPEFVTDKMSQSKLLSIARDLIRSNFNFVVVAIYLRGYQKTDFMNFAVLVCDV